jgi:hypothetical protein
MNFPHKLSAQTSNTITPSKPLLYQRIRKLGPKNLCYVIDSQDQILPSRIKIRRSGRHRIIFSKTATIWFSGRNRPGRTLPQYRVDSPAKLQVGMIYAAITGYGWSKKIYRTP